MRNTTKVTFVYEKNAGKLGATSKDKKEKTILCNITELGAEKSELIAGNLKERTIVARTLVNYDDPITYVVINNKKYNCIKRITYLRGSSFYLVERKG